MRRCCLKDADKVAGISIILRNINQARQGESPGVRLLRMLRKASHMPPKLPRLSSKPLATDTEPWNSCLSPPANL